ncbi:uncharacterized protein LOC109861964 [Pseudomyrmex gracilis]|uniref:uncharacterized protein LOC109861964 n=1 Tax=Pseudomyrmex gracilis TaxID=219809 RepID=UPI0009955FFD|nr:uncharacterized protein LOC109861964 [Pseudomyrmex gracilis]
MTQKNTAPGPDGVPGKVLGFAFGQGPLGDRLRHIFTKCLRTNWFPSKWKRARLILLRKGGRPADSPSAYRPICLLDEAGKLLERIIANRLVEHLSRMGPDLADCQYGFRERRSTVDAVFRLKSLTEASVRGLAVICYADDTLVVASGEDWSRTKALAECSTNCVVGRIERLGLKVAVHKTEAMWFHGPCRGRPAGLDLSVGEARVEIGTTIKYLGLYLDPTWRFGEHFARLAPRVRKVANALARIQPNLGGPKTKVRRLYGNVVHSVALYGAPLWAEAAMRAGARSSFGQLCAAQRLAALRVISGFRTVATETTGVLAGMPPLALLAGMYSAKYSRRVELLHQEGLAINTLQETLAMSKRHARRQLLFGWGQFLDEPRAAAQKVVGILRPHLEVWLEHGVGRLTYRTTQVLTGHGCFGEYLCRIGRDPTTRCYKCGAARDTPKHTVGECPRWARERQDLIVVIENNLSLEGLLRALVSREREVWQSLLVDRF